METSTRTGETDQGMTQSRHTLTNISAFSGQIGQNHLHIAMQNDRIAANITTNFSKIL
jgi:hypothetical protein